MVELSTFNRNVAGSIPAGRTQPVAYVVMHMSVAHGNRLQVPTG